MADNFGLDGLRDGFKKRAAELAHADNVDARSFDEPEPGEDEGPFKPYTFQQSDFDRTEPDKDNMRKYWRQFETTPFVRKSISSFASQVMEPGYYIIASGLEEDELVKLDHWLSESSIIEGEPGQNFRQLAKKAIVQQEVRGTAFVEKAPDKNDPDKIAGLKLINAETMEAVTRPGQSILLHPDDDEEYPSAPEAESGGAAAWLQDLGETESFFGTPVSREDRKDKDSDFKIGFRRDEIIKLARDADAGEVFGTSRLEAVSDRIEGLRNKLSDNDDAIASKAYPLWLFLFGTEENPWDADDINEFMRSHEMENFHAGMKQGVRGDVNVKTVSGEVAEIADALQFDIDWIMSIMPIPTYMIGAFGQDAVGQFGGVAQQQELQRQIKDTRRDLEDRFTPLLKEVAEQMDFDEDAVDTIRLKIGEPGEPEPETPQRENIIRYIPKDQRDPTPSQPSDEDPNQSPGSDGVPNELPGQETESPDDVPAEAGAQVWHTDSGISQLSMHRDSELADIIYETMRDAREETLQKVNDDFQNAPIFAASNFENIANGVLRRKMSRAEFRDRVKPIVEDLVSDDSSFTRSNNVRFFSQNIEHATEDALEEMLRLMRIQVRRDANNGVEWDDTEQRIRNKYNDANLRERAELIAHMEQKNIVENVKLQRFESDEEVVGVRASNDDPSTPLTQSLAGAEAYFDSDESIQQQLMSATRSEFLQKGFDPLPPTPPFHFNDTTTLEPIKNDS